MMLTRLYRNTFRDPIKSEAPLPLSGRKGPKNITGPGRLKPLRPEVMTYLYSHLHITAEKPRRDETRRDWVNGARQEMDMEMEEGSALPASAVSLASSSPSKRLDIKHATQTNFGDDYVFQIASRYGNEVSVHSLLSLQDKVRWWIGIREGFNLERSCGLGCLRSREM